MRVVRVSYGGQAFYAQLLQDEIRPLDSTVKAPSSIPLSEVELELPVTPSKVICAGLNYHAHARELGLEVPEEPLLFLKPPSSLVGSGGTIRLPEQSEEVHYEAELAVVMGRQCHKAGIREAGEAVFGYCCANDVTARDLQRKDVQYTRAKGFDTFCPVGPWIETEFPLQQDPGIWATVNDETRQRGGIGDMVFSPHALVSFASSIMTLHPGDLILTGTPPGVGSIHDGDRIRIGVEGIGELENPVRG